MDIGKRNSETAIATLKKEGIPLRSKDIGGSRGRTVSINLDTGILSIQIDGKLVAEI